MRVAARLTWPATMTCPKGWVSKLIARYRAEGEAAFEPRSRSPRRNPRVTPSTTAKLILLIRRELTAKGLDAGADTIVWHLANHHQLTVSRATMYRILRRNGLAKVEPKKRPRSS